MGAALAFAKNTASPTIYIVGRNSQAGDKIVQDIKSLNPNATAVFLRHDLSLISEADKLCDHIKQTESKVNSLVLSSGFINMAGRDESSEGIDKIMSVMYYSRMRVVQQLIPLLENAANANEPARVVTVLLAGVEGHINEDDLECTAHYSFPQIRQQRATLHSLAVEHLARKYPTLSFSHYNPGIVNTGIFRELPGWLRIPLSPLMLFGESAERSGEKVFKVAYSGKEYGQGPHLLSSKLVSVRKSALQYLPIELQDKAWAHTEEVFNRVLTN